MRPQEAVWFESGPAFDTGSRENGELPRAVLTYPRQNVLASGWLLGEKHLSNRAAVVDVPIGRGHLVLMGIRPQYRAQSNATFKLLFPLVPSTPMGLQLLCTAVRSTATSSHSEIAST